jgi:hypothetical protein
VTERYVFEGELRSVREIKALAPAFGEITIRRAIDDGAATIWDLLAWDARREQYRRRIKAQTAKKNRFRRA